MFFSAMLSLFKVKITVHPTLWPLYMSKYKCCSLMNSRNKMVLLEYTCTSTFSYKITNFVGKSAGCEVTHFFLQIFHMYQCWINGCLTSQPLLQPYNAKVQTDPNLKESTFFSSFGGAAQFLKTTLALLFFWRDKNFLNQVTYVKLEVKIKMLNSCCWQLVSGGSLVCQTVFGWAVEKPSGSTLVTVEWLSCSN